MRRIAATLILLVICYGLSAQAGIYAGSYKKWVKKEVEVHKEAVFFKGHQLGANLTVLEDVELDYFISVYEKGTTSIILLVTRKKDALNYIIQDVIEVKNVRSIDNIQTGSCSLKESYDARIVVLEKNIKGKPVNTKAWRVDLDKVRFYTISPRGINCLVEGAD